MDRILSTSPPVSDPLAALRAHQPLSDEQVQSMVDGFAAKQAGAMHTARARWAAALACNTVALVWLIGLGGYVALEARLGGAVVVVACGLGILELLALNEIVYRRASTLRARVSLFKMEQGLCVLGPYAVNQLLDRAEAHAPIRAIVASWQVKTLRARDSEVVRKAAMAFDEAQAYQQSRDRWNQLGRRNEATASSAAT